MNRPTNRRQALKGLGLATASLTATSSVEAGEDPDTQLSLPPGLPWHQTNDRVWIGREYWANPMEDWCIRDGAVECLSKESGRNVHWITKRIAAPERGFETSIVVSVAEAGKNDGGFGFRIGVRSDIDEYRSNCFAGGGTAVGVKGGKLFLRKRTVPVELDADATARLNFKCEPLSGGRVRAQVSVFAENGQLLGTIGENVSPEVLVGNICFVNGNQAKRKGLTRYRFQDWLLEGDGIEEELENTFGPVLWSMYTLNDSTGEDGVVLRLTALMPPIGQKDRNTVELQSKQSGHWKSLASSKIDADAFTATFEVRNWDCVADVEYRVVYEEVGREDASSTASLEGIIRRNPSGRPLRMAALTCQKDYAFPYEPVAQNVAKLDPDLIYFSGDQLYENHGGFGIIREPADRAILNYLRKFYMFGWAFRDCMRNAPTICIPDDHDVFQGNIWGENGAAMKDLAGGASSKGGYREPARMVNVVHKTNASHHPRPFDSSPVLQGISVYFGELVYGNVGFAILSDRQFKSGPTRVETGSGRADHVLDPSFDTSVLDKEGLVLLGERQEAFLTSWAQKWNGHSMKVVLSQTVFAGVATHHGKFDGYLKADLDAGGWPQTARDRAIEILRVAKPLHINGDQHLTSLCQYGTLEQRDAFWSFCTPAIAAGYPRWWRPDDIDMPHHNRPQHGLANTGEYVDGFGNLIYVYAVGNPDVGSEANRYDLAHQKASGFGFVTIDPEQKTYKMEAFRFHCDPTSGDRNAQFPGWPVVIQQSDNDGGKSIG